MTVKKTAVRENIEFTAPQKRLAKEFMENLADRIRDIMSIEPLFIWDKNHQNTLRDSLTNDFVALINSGVFSEIHYGSTDLEKTTFMNKMITEYCPNYATAYLKAGE